jgi:hypothetical protein
MQPEAAKNSEPLLLASDLRNQTMTLNETMIILHKVPLAKLATTLSSQTAYLTKNKASK